VLCDERPTFSGEGDSGAFAEFVRVHASQLFRVPAGLPLRAAALAEPLAVALHAITRSGIEAGRRALVSGAGPLGLLVIAALRARGVDDVTVSEPVAYRRERAGRVGATRLLHPDELEHIAMPFDVLPNGFHAVFECSGAPSAIESAVGQLRRAGTLVLVGTGRGRAKLDHHRILLNELVLTGAFNYDADGFPRALELLASGRLPLDALIEPDDFLLAELPDALAKLAAGELAGKVMIVPKDPARGRA
jgi:2-desacetyl-2-hydroxyethyl bacteriochlorophyllide A dehydrogenase